MANDDLRRVVEDEEEEQDQAIGIDAGALHGACTRNRALRELISSKDIALDVKVYLIEDMIDRDRDFEE